MGFRKSLIFGEKNRDSCFPDNTQKSFQTVLKPSRKWEMTWKIRPKMRNDLEKTGEFLKSSRKWEMIRTNLDSPETVWKMGNDLEKSGQI